MISARHIRRCQDEIVAAFFTVLTGHDAITCASVPLDQALLYLTDWQHELFLILREAGFPLESTSPISTDSQALSMLAGYWSAQPCGACKAPVPTCAYRPAALADFHEYVARLEAAAARQPTRVAALERHK